MSEQLKKLMTGTVSQYRLPMFLPINHPPRGFFAPKGTGEERITETPWGQVSVKGILTQIHRDVLDAIMVVAEENWVVDNCMKVKFDPAKVIRRIKPKTRTNLTWLMRLIKSMGDVEAELQISGQSRSIYSNVVKQVEYDSEIERKRKLVRQKGYEGTVQSNYWIVELSAAFTTLFKTELNINYAEVLPDIVRLKHGLSKAVARWFLTHQDAQTKSVETVLSAVGVNIANRGRISESIPKLSEDSKILLELGIRIDGKKIHYKPVKGRVGFMKPLSEQSNRTQKKPSIIVENSALHIAQESRPYVYEFF
jgi:hypothetical protein